MGDHPQTVFTALMDRYGFIGDVRGKGLLLAFEMVADRATMRRCPKRSTRIPGSWNSLTSEASSSIPGGRAAGMRAITSSYAPPLIVTEAQIDEMMAMLVDALDAFAGEAGLAVAA
jgi:4-aminobutyrate aminotransferase-like enzyme